jgi:hypothetical protein
MEKQTADNEKQIQPTENADAKEDITSADIKNAHASGDGSIKRSEESITEITTGTKKEVKTSGNNY